MRRPGCRRFGWHVKVHRTGRLRGLILIERGCVPRGRRRFSSRSEALAAAAQRARQSGSWMLAGVEV